MSPLFAVLFGLPGHLELLIVAFVMLLLFGHRLPSVMASLGRSINVFRRTVSEADSLADDNGAGGEPRSPA